MLDNGIGRSSQQLYGQFLYKLKEYGIKNISVFSKPNFFTSSGFIKFRELVWSDFKLMSGFIMDASEFGDVKQWPLTFTVWESK